MYEFYPEQCDTDRIVQELRDVFMYGSLGGMFTHYYEIMAMLDSGHTNMPDAESLRLETFTGEPVKARDLAEYRKAMVGDVQLYLKRLPWYEMAILLGRMPPPGKNQISWRKLVRKLKDISKGRSYPRVFMTHGNLFNQYRHRIRPEAERHFREVGYLR